MADRIGFIGVGAMGSAIASRLVAKHELLVNDRNRSAADELIAAGAQFATVAEIAAECSEVFVCLPGPPNVKDLVLGPDGIGSELREEAMVIDTSTSTPTVDREIAETLEARGVRFVDAPIGGGVRRAREGTSTLMVGATDADFALVRPLLEDVTPNVRHVGGPGAGHAMKLVNNLLNSINRYAALEAVRLGEACGIAQDTVVEVLNTSTGRNYATEYTFPTLLSGDTYKLQGFTLELMLKDIRLATDLAESHGHATPLGDAAADFTRTAIQRFGPGADQSQLMAQWYDRGELTQQGPPGS